MWVFLNDAMLSIVQKPADKAGTLTVRGRIKGDIERVFPGAVVIAGAGTDYRFRATIPREGVANAMHNQVMNLENGNFKGSVKDRQRHGVYMQVWQEMHSYQQRSK